MNLRRRQAYLTCALTAVIVGSWSCKSEAPQAPQPIVAQVAHVPVKPGNTVRATLTSSSVMPRPPSKKLKRVGVFRAVEMNTEFTGTVAAVLETKSKDETGWRITYEDLANVSKTSAASSARTDHGLPQTTLLWSRSNDNESVTAQDGAEPTESQIEITAALARALDAREAWGAFLGTREFERGNLVELPGGLTLGGLYEASFGPVAESHGTVSLFRMGMQDGDEVAHFDINSKVTTAVQDEVYYDLVLSGKAILRIVDGAMLHYEVGGKVTPRAPTGEMLSTGSGRWSETFRLDAETHRPQ